MSWQCFQTLPSLHIPYPYTLIKLEAQKKKHTHQVLLSPKHTHRHAYNAHNAHSERFSKGLTSAFHLLLVLRQELRTHRSRHDEIGLGVEVAAEDVVAVTF